MALDLLDINGDGVSGYVVAMMCSEAGVCIRDNDDAERDSNQVEMHAATYDVHDGFVVTDSNGKKFRLRVTAEPLDRGDASGAKT